jgi:hypothetical protein
MKVNARAQTASNPLSVLRSARFRDGTVGAVFRFNVSIL